MDNFRVILGRRIYLARTAKFYQQNTLAEAIGISNSYLCEIERGKKKLSAEKLFKISKVLSVSTDELNPYIPLKEGKIYPDLRLTDVIPNLKRHF